MFVSGGKGWSAGFCNDSRRMSGLGADRLKKRGKIKFISSSLVYLDNSVKENTCTSPYMLKNKAVFLLQPYFSAITTFPVTYLTKSISFCIKNFNYLC